jgi:hypothetical protein
LVHSNAFTVGTGPLSLWITSTDLAVVVSEALETAHFLALIRSISALSFTTTVLGVIDTLTVGTGELRLWITSTYLGVVHLEALETTLFVKLIRLVHALWLSVTELTLVDTLVVLALPLISLATALFVVIEPKVLETALLVTFVRLIRALSFSVTDFFLEDTVTIGTSNLSIWITATDLGVVEWESFEATLGFVLVGVVGAVFVTIAVGALHDALSRDALEHVWWTESSVMSTSISVNGGVLVQVRTGEIEFVVGTDSEGPFGGTIAALLRSVELNNVISSV